MCVGQQHLHAHTFPFSRSPTTNIKVFGDYVSRYYTCMYNTNFKGSGYIYGTPSSFAIMPYTLVPYTTHHTHHTSCTLPESLHPQNTCTIYEQFLIFYIIFYLILLFNSVVLSDITIQIFIQCVWIGCARQPCTHRR